MTEDARNLLKVFGISSEHPYMPSFAGAVRCMLKEGAQVDEIQKSFLKNMMNQFLDEEEGNRFDPSIRHHMVEARSIATWINSLS